MNIILVEDDDLKYRKVQQFLEGIGCLGILEIAKSVNEGMRQLRDKAFDVILLDMSLPTYSITPEEAGWRPQPYGGVEILKFMERKKIFTPVIVITQLASFGKGQDQLDTSSLDLKLREEYSRIYTGLVRYESSSDEWQQELVIQLERIAPGWKNLR